MNEHPTPQHFERERAAALRGMAARTDTRRGRWAAWVAWRLTARADAADRVAGLGADTTTTDVPPARPWRRDPDRKTARDQRKQHVPTQADGDFDWLIEAAVGVALRVAVVAVVVVSGAWIMPLTCAFVLIGWWALVPRIGPIRPARVAWTGAGLLAAAIGAALVAVAVHHPVWRGPVWPGITHVSGLWVTITATVWMGAGLLAAAWIARTVLGWRSPVADRTTPTTGVAPMITITDDGDADGISHA